jgi:hypothetical protein
MKEITFCLLLYYHRESMISRGYYHGDKMKKAGPKNPAVEYAKRALVQAVGRSSDQFMLRLPDGMRDMIAEMAERNGRSMNAEIVSALAHQIARFAPNASVPPGMGEIMADAMVERIMRGEIQYEVRAAGQKLEAIAKELDQMTAESRAVSKKKSPPE